MPPKRKPTVRDRAKVEEGESPQPVERPFPIIKVVGISGSGKSTLVKALRAAGYDARPVSQEHSNVLTLWQQFERTGYLIYLFVSLETQRSRRQDVTWTEEAHQEEMRRLAHAREHADLRIDTDRLSPEGVLAVALSYLTRRRVRHASGALGPLPATGSAVSSS
jgi:hypothetical protein